MVRGRIAIAGLASLALAAVFSGCVVFTAPPTVKQVKKQPKVKVMFEVCLSDPDEGSGCQDGGNSGVYNGPNEMRLLVAFRVPKGTKAPQSFEPKSVETDNPPTDTLVLSRDASYKRELNQKAPRNAKKFKYLGYSSNGIDVPSETGGLNAVARFAVKMTVPQDRVGKRFKVRPVVGTYEVSEDQPVDEPIDCGPDPFEDQGFGSSGEFLICIDSPSPDEFDNAKAKVKRKKR